MSDSSKSCAVWLNVSTSAPDEWTNCKQAPSLNSALEMSSDWLPWKLKWQTLLATADALCTGRMRALPQWASGSPPAQPVRTPTYPPQKPESENLKQPLKTQLGKQKCTNDSFQPSEHRGTSSYQLGKNNVSSRQLLLKEARTNKLWQYLFLLTAVNEQKIPFPVNVAIYSSRTQLAASRFVIPQDWKTESISRE